MSGSTQSKRARMGAIGFTLIAVLLALASAFLLAHLMKGRGYDQDALVNVVIAKQDLSPGVPVEEDQLELKLWPKKSVPNGAFRTTKKLLESDKKVPLQMILKGEPILTARLSHPKRGSGMAPLVPANFRAFPVQVERWVALSKMLYPGAVVDVMSTVKLEEGGLTSRTILQGIKVLAVNGAVDGTTFVRGNPKRKKKDARRARTVATLLLLPDQAEQLALATRVGKIDIVLRGASDGSTIESQGVNVEALYPHLSVVPEDDSLPTVKTPTKKAKVAKRKTRRTGGVRMRKKSRRGRSSSKKQSKPSSTIVGG